jgi:hypothetical protein
MTLRARKLGIAEVPTNAKAPPFMKPLLVMGGWAMGYLLRCCLKLPVP